MLFPCLLVVLKGRVQRLQIRLLFVLDQQNQSKHDHGHNQRGQEDICIRHEGFGAVTVDNSFSVCQHHLTDPRPDHTRQKHLRENAHALQSARLTHRRQVADLCPEHRRTAKVAAHHQQRADKDKQLGAEEEQHDKARAHPKHGKDTCQLEAFFVIYPAPQRGGNRRKDNGRCHDQHVIRHAQRDLVIDDEIGHEDLNGDIEQHEHGKMQVKSHVLLNRRRAEAVEHSGKIAVRRGLDCGIADQEKSQHTCNQHNTADDAEHDRPVKRHILRNACRHEHHAAKHEQNGDQRHHGIESLGSTAVFLGSAVGQPRIERCIIGC